MALSRHQFLQDLHRVLEPRTYLEIGVDDGRSLTYASCPTVAIDPAFHVESEIRTDIHLVRSTSDEFFGRRDPLAHLPRPLIDLAFIDGMHLSDFTLRDFMNVERYCASGSVIVLDDMLSRNVDEAARDRHTQAWTGDVYKVLTVLRELRPDLVVLDVNTGGTGVGLILLPDPTSSVLAERYDDLVPDLVSPDPQDVPDEVLHRTRAIDPGAVIESDIWRRWRQRRDRRRGGRVADFRTLLDEVDWARPAAAPSDAAEPDPGLVLSS